MAAQRHLERETTNKGLIDELVSIIVPVYNARPYLPQMLESIVSQTYAAWELLLIDDCSQDGSYEYLNEWSDQWNANKMNDTRERFQSITLLKNAKQSGPAASRNEGLKKAKGRYLCFLDADDYWQAEKLKKQLAFMRKESLAFSFTGYEFANQNGVRNGKVVHVPKMMNYRQALKNTTISTITVMLDRCKVKDELIMMPLNVQGEDSATWWQILKNGYVAYGLDECLSVYRRHENSLSSNKLLAVKGVWDKYRKVEKMGLIDSAYCFMIYAVRAVLRRI